MTLPQFAGFRFDVVGSPLCDTRTYALCMSAAALRSRRDVVPTLLSAVAGALGRGRAAPRAILLTAPSGAGKSYLLREFRDRLTVPARYASAAEATITRPFGVAADLLEIEPANTNPQSFFAAIDQHLTGHSLVLVVDDLQFADAESLGLLHEVITLDAPIVLVASRRPQPTRNAISRLVSLPQAADWPVPALDRVEVDVVVHDRTDAWPGPRLRSLLESVADNALHLTAVLDGLVASGAATGTDVIELAAEQDKPPRTLATTVDDIVRRLEGQELDLARVLAVFGQPTDPDELAAVLSVEPMTLIGPIQRLLDTGLVTATGDDLDFAHDAYRESTYTHIPDLLKALLHRAIGNRRQSPVERARHVMAAEPDSQELLDAVHDAVDLLGDAPAVTADLLATASGHTQDATVAAELAVTRARALAQSGQLQLADQVAAEALAWATKPEIIAELRRISIFAASTGGRVDDAIALVDDVLGGPVPDRPRQILTDHRRFLVLLGGRQPVPLTPLADDPRALTLNGLITELLRRFLLGETGVALEYAWAASRRMLAQNPDPHEGMSADLWTPYVALGHQGADAARATLHELIERREERGATWLTAGHHAIGGGIDLQSAHLDDAAAQFDTALEVAARMELGSMTQALAGRAIVDVLRGDTKAARDRIEKWNAPDEFGVPTLDRTRVLILEAERRYTDAARLASQTWTRAGRLHLHSWQILVGPEFARVGLRASDESLNRLIHDDLAALPEPPGRPARAAARLTRLITGPDYATLAEVGPELAAETAAVGNHLLSLVAVEESAVATAVTGDKETARTLARQAIAAAEDAGAKGVAARIAGRLRSAGARLGSTATRARPDFGWQSLTPTEHRIVDLVASGSTGPEIARQLYLSPRTVQTHVSHALGKLGLANRVELAAAAARRGSHANG